MIEHLADALRNNTVTSSSIHFSQIYLHFFAQALTTLILWNNQIETAGAQHLGDVLRDNAVMLFFHLSRIHLHFSHRH